MVIVYRESVATPRKRRDYIKANVSNGGGYVADFTAPEGKTRATPRHRVGLVGTAQQ